MKLRGKEKILSEIRKFIKKYTKKAKRGYNQILVGETDDVKCYKMIRVIAELWPVDSKQREETPEVEILLDKIWVLYFFFKQNIDGKKTNYINIVNKYSLYEKIIIDRKNKNK